MNDTDNGMDYEPLEGVPQLFYPPPNGHEFSDPVLLREFIESGKAIITLYSQETTKHYTYKIKAKGADCWYVTCRGVNDGWDYIGSIWDQQFRYTRATPRKFIDTPKYLAFSWFHRHLMNGQIPAKLVVYHEGRCGMCGAALTDPESIKQGYGPECRKKRYRRPPVCDSVNP